MNRTDWKAAVIQYQTFRRIGFTHERAMQMVQEDLRQLQDNRLTFAHLTTKERAL